MEKSLENYLYKNIPITKAMGIKVELASLPKVIIFVPLAQNINHKKTVFGGSLHAAATLACWGLLHLNLKEEIEEPVQIVITNSTVDYLYPVDDDFRVESLQPDNVSWQKFVKMINAKGKGRIEMSATIKHKNHRAINYKAEFAAIGTKQLKAEG